MNELVDNFRNELARLYADNKPGRRLHILTATARLRAKYNAKLVNAGRNDPQGAAAAERAIMRTENEFAAELAA
jgi:hypothetical protein